MPFVAALLLMYGVPVPRLTALKTNLFIPVLIAAALLNLVVNAQGAATDKPSYFAEYDNGVNFALIAKLEGTGVSKGYSEYFSAQINAYLSGGNLNIQPVACYRDGFTSPDIMFIDKDRYLAPSKKSFYVFDTYNAPKCTQAQVRAQFGTPARVLTSGKYTIYLYNYDLLGKMDQSWLRKNYN
jgi:hypothetical protein